MPTVFLLDVCFQVLAVYPTTIRRRILRQLYSVSMHECYLFNKCGVKFLDALMLGARVELFLPKVGSGIVQCLDFCMQHLGTVQGACADGRRCCHKQVSLGLHAGCGVWCQQDWPPTSAMPVRTCSTSVWQHCCLAKVPAWLWPTPAQADF